MEPNILTLSISVAILLLVIFLFISYVKAPPSNAYIISGLSKEPVYSLDPEVSASPSLSVWM